MNTQAPKQSPQSATDELIGRIINDRFRIISVIARGGMGRVYRAEQVPLGRLVAIKTLDPRGHGGDNDPQFQQRFFLEASVASKLQHPNTVTVFDYGRTSDGVYFIAMELVEGRSLFHVIRDDAPLQPARVIHVALQIARSLREAHRLDVIHRDLKPGNVLLTHHGDEEDFVKVLDFGLVKHVESEAEQELTKAGLFMGSPKYMSPEQIRGERVDARSDIYALGVVMYEMITGRVPFERDNTVKVLMAHMHEQVPPITTPDVPQPLVELVMRCLDKRPDGRPASMDEVILRLKQSMGLSLTTSGAFALGPDMRLPPLGSQTGRIPTMTGGQYRPGAYSMMNTLTGEIMSPLARNVQTQSGYTTGQVPQPQGLPAFTPAQIPGMITQPVMTGAIPPMHSQSQPPPAAAPSTPWLPRVVVVASLFVAAGFLALRFTEQGQTLVLTRTGPALNAPAQPSGTPAQQQAPQGPGRDQNAPLPAPAPEQAAPAQHHVVVTLTTVPAGAYVWADDKPYGQTPANIEWWGDQAAPGREVRFTFSRDGYEKATVVRSITGERLDIEAVLNRVPFVPRRRPAASATGVGTEGNSAAPSAPAAGAPAGPAAKPGEAAPHSGVNVDPDEFKSDPY
jgi:eukaryotic-like serine/threonine-protein kinase